MPLLTFSEFGSREDGCGNHFQTLRRLFLFLCWKRVFGFHLPVGVIYTRALYFQTQYFLFNSLSMSLLKCKFHESRNWVEHDHGYIPNTPAQRLPHSRCSINLYWMESIKYTFIYLILKILHSMALATFLGMSPVHLFFCQDTVEGRKLFEFWSVIQIMLLLL